MLGMQDEIFNEKINNLEILELFKGWFLQRAQCLHCKRCISYSNSVRPSVCPSVRHTLVLS